MDSLRTARVVKQSLHNDITHFPSKCFRTFKRKENQNIESEIAKLFEHIDEGSTIACANCRYSGKERQDDFIFHLRCYPKYWNRHSSIGNSRLLQP